MARMTIKTGAEYSLKLSRYAADSERIAKKAIYAGAKIVADEIKKNLKEVISDDSTGDLIESFGISKISPDKNGDYNAKIGFDGYDRNGVPNQLKARVIESGKSGQQKRPFARPAIKATMQSAIDAMNNVIQEETSKIFKD